MDKMHPNPDPIHSSVNNWPMRRLHFVAQAGAGVSSLVKNGLGGLGLELGLGLGLGFITVPVHWVCLHMVCPHILTLTLSLTLSPTLNLTLTLTPTRTPTLTRTLRCLCRCLCLRLRLCLALPCLALPYLRPCLCLCLLSVSRCCNPCVRSFSGRCERWYLFFLGVRVLEKTV